MPERIIKGILLDVDYENKETPEGNRSIIRLFVRTEKGIEIFEDQAFKPYFYVTASDVTEAEAALRKAVFAENSRIAAIRKQQKTNAEKVLLLEFNSVGDLTNARQSIESIAAGLQKFEYDIPFAKRYLLDRQLQPMGAIELTVEGSEIKKAENVEAEEQKLKIAAFDLETLSPGRFSDPKKDPILMISFAVGNKAVVLSHGKKFSHPAVKCFETEKEMIAEFIRLVRESDLDIIVTYNGDSFDFPYLKERANRFGLHLNIAPDETEPRAIKKGKDSAVKLHGLQHLDAYRMLLFLNRFAVVSLIKFDLESVAAALFGEKKVKLFSEQINEIWGSGKGLDELADYCKEDSETALRISEQYLPLLVELCKLVRLPLFEVGRGNASLLVEYLLMAKCAKSGTLTANKPSDQETQQRLLQMYKGGYVKEPLPGLHENIAVLDFSSLYPTIIISHNISLETVNCGHAECREKNSGPNKQWFCMKKKGMISSILQELFEKRMRIKKQLKQERGKERLLLNARQHALKILMNSFYGYLGYSRSRFYSRECASAITAWGRHYVTEVGAAAEKAGFTVLYSDTDSEFLIIPKGKSKEDVEKFVEQINKQLPDVMNLEVEGFYKRGIFVTKDSGEGAKKKYALIDFDDKLKIVGFEYVRRDWARIAKETQKEVIKAVLQDGSKEKAIQIIRGRVAALKEGKVQKDELVVLTQIKRPLNKYESIGPHVAAAKKAVAKGKEIGVGSVIGYIITRSGKSISDKAQLAEYVKEGNYDAEYYIHNQVLPAVMKIIREFDISKEDLLQGGKQAKLASFNQ